MYSSAVLLGAGASIIWVAQGFILANNSTNQDLLRNSGLFWLLFHLSGILGNIFVIFVSQSYQNFNHQAKNLVVTLSFPSTRNINLILDCRVSALLDLHWAGLNAPLQTDPVL